MRVLRKQVRDRPGPAVHDGVIEAARATPALAGAIAAQDRRAQHCPALRAAWSDAAGGLAAQVRALREPFANQRGEFQTAPRSPRMEVLPCGIWQLFWLLRSRWAPWRVAQACPDQMKTTSAQVASTDGQTAPQSTKVRIPARP